MMKMTFAMWGVISGLVFMLSSYVLSTTVFAQQPSEERDASGLTKVDTDNALNTVTGPGDVHMSSVTASGTYEINQVLPNKEEEQTLKTGDTSEAQSAVGNKGTGDESDLPQSTATGDLTDVYPPGSKTKPNEVGVEGQPWKRTLVPKIQSDVADDQGSEPVSEGIQEDVASDGSNSAVWDSGEYSPGASGEVDYRDTDSDGDGLGDTARGIEKSDIRRGMPIGKPFPTSIGSSTDGTIIEHTDWILIGAVGSGGGAGKATFKEMLQTAEVAEADATEFLDKLNHVKAEVVLDESTGEWGLQHFSVKVDDIGKWTTAEQGALRVLQQNVATNSPHAAVLDILDIVRNDDRIERITSDTKNLSVEYRAHIKLFGFIPLDNTVVATLQLPGVDDVVWDTQVAIDWPWYVRFFSTKPSADEIDTTLQTVAKKAKFKAGKALADTVK